MAINLSDILLVSDVDETLVEAPAPIPPSNSAFYRAGRTLCDRDWSLSIFHQTVC